MYKFLVIIERAGSNYSAYSPDLPGCIATGDTKEETEENMYEALKIHINGLIEDQKPIPESKSMSEYIMVK